MYSCLTTHSSQVCFNAFKLFYDISPKTLYKRVKEVRANVESPHKRQYNGKLRWSARDIAVEWMRDYFEFTACIMPTSRGSDVPERQLPSSLTKRMVHEQYKIYCEECSEQGKNVYFVMRPNETRSRNLAPVTKWKFRQLSEMYILSCDRMRPVAVTGHRLQSPNSDVCPKCIFCHATE